MQINKITLRNFRNFKNASIEFSCDKDKYFTIILGQNTYGKTTLVKSFIWCLYRTNLFNDPILLNNDVQEEMLPNTNKEVRVELELEHKGFSYRIITKETYRKNSSGKVSVFSKVQTSIVKINGENTETLLGARAEDEIDSILRPELKEYFFFDGETNSIENINSKKNLTNAVTNILGLNRLEMFKDYFDPTKNESVVSYLRKELKAGEDELFEDLSSEFEEKCQKKESIEKEINDTREEIGKLREQLKQENDKLDQNKDIIQDQLDKKTLEREIVDLKASKKQDFSRMINSFNSSNAFLKVLFADSFEKFNLDKLQQSSSFYSEKTFIGIIEEAVDELIKKGRCICGAEIKNGNDAYNHLVEAKQHMEPHDYGKYLSDFVSTESSNVYNAQTTFDSILSNAGKINDAIETIDDDEQRLKSIKERIAGRADVGEIQKNINIMEGQIQFQKSTLNRLENKDLPDINREIQDLNNKIQKSSSKNKYNDFINQCLAYATNIYNIAVKQIEKNKVDIRAKLQEEVGTIFKSMYHGNRDIYIDENFKVFALVKEHSGNDKRLDKSTGLGAVVNYSFVAGLMNLAKKHIINDGDISDDSETTEIYPLVMDAPFSNTDDEHIKNICKNLPNFCDQIIMFIMEKDYNYAKESIEAKVGKIYQIEKISETESNIMEL